MAWKERITDRDIGAVRPVRSVLPFQFVPSYPERAE
jgi:hypothetical protein